MVISLVHATRGRPHLASICKGAWLARASGENEIEYIFSLDTGDTPPDTKGARVIIGPPKGSTPAYNRGVYISTGEVVIAVMDDCTPPKDWDKAIIERLGDVSRPAVLKVSDGSNANPDKPWLITVQIVTRAWLKKCGYLFYPEYRHVFADDDLSRKAYIEGAIVHAPDIVFQHAWIGSDYDETARFNYSPDQWESAAKILIRRIAENFPDAPQLWGQQ